MAPLSIVLVRHATSIANLDPTEYLRTPDHTIPLARPDDDEAAISAGDLVRGLGFDPADVCSWCSTYVRCRQTEQLVMRRAFGDRWESIRRRESFLLREQEFGDWDGLDEDEIRARDPERADKRQRLVDVQGRFYFRYPGGESRADVVQRMSIFLGKLHRSDYRHHVVFLHGVTQRAFRMAWFDRSPEWFEQEPNPRNASLMIVARGPDGRWVERAPRSASIPPAALVVCSCPLFRTARNALTPKPLSPKKRGELSSTFWLQIACSHVQSTRLEQAWRTGDRTALCSPLPLGERGRG
jgi:broad specificity phosphatase PhoE